ncbi:Sideroflexin-5, variant 2 [Bonamia ostreae]
MLLMTSDKKLKRAVSLLEEYKTGKIKKLSDAVNRELWEAKKITDSILHPQTKEKIPLPCRFAAFVPMNIPIILGMISAKTIQAQLFWQWYNQSYNVAINHSNGNKTNPMSPQKIASAYLMALTVSCGMSVSISKLVKPASKISPIAGIAARATVPFLSVAAASVSNVLLMRYNETVKGIELKNKDGEVVGSSKKAAHKALRQVSLSRAIFPIPTILFPALVKSIMERKLVFKNMPRMAMPFNIALITATTFISLPVSIGLFPQIGSAKISELEDCFKGLKLSDGSPVETLYFNKGL